MAEDLTRIERAIVMKVAEEEVHLPSARLKIKLNNLARAQKAFDDEDLAHITAHGGETFAWLFESYREFLLRAGDAIDAMLEEVKDGT